MALRWVRYLLLFAGSNLLSQSSNATEEGHQTLYEEAQAAISSSQPEKAIEHLLNLVETTPDHAGAWLDLAILFCQLGEEQRARQLLNKIEENFPLPPAIREIVDYYRRHSCLPATPRFSWFGSLRLGYESNVNQGTKESIVPLGTGPGAFELELDDSARPLSDFYTGLTADFSRQLADSENWASAHMRIRKYNHLEEFNLAAFSTDYEHNWSVNSWHHQATATASATLLGGRMYQYSAGILWQVEPDSAPLLQHPLSLTGSIIGYRYPNNHAFDSLIGSLDAQITFSGNQNWRSQISAGWVFDQAVQNRAGGDRTGWIIKARGIRHLTGPWTADVSTQLDFIKYRDDSYLPGLFDIQRKEQRVQLQIGVNRMIDQNQYFRLELKQTQNRDSIDLFTFNNTSVMLSWNITGVD